MSTVIAKNPSIKILNQLLGFIKPYKGRFILSLVLCIVLAVIAPVRPYLISLSVDEYIANNLWQMLVNITIIQVGILFIENGLKFFFLYLTNWTGQNVVNDMRQQVFNKVVHQKLSFFDKTPIGTLTTRTINDIEAVNDVFANGLISILADILTIIAIMGIMFYTDWRLTLVSLSVFPILIVATYFFKESVKKSFQSVRNAVAQLNAFVQEHISGMYIVQVFGATKNEQEKFEEINRHHRDANIKSIFAYSVFFPVVEIILALATGLLVWYGASEMMEMTVSQGVIISFTMYINQLFRPLRMLADKFNTLQMGIIAGERVLKVLDSDEHLQHNGTVQPEKIVGDVEFHDVHFEYVPHVPVLNGISFHVNSGETLALVGHTGAGKSSIINILTRLYEIKSGKIYIDGIELREYDIYKLRQKVAVVLQDVYLFSGSIFDNIAMGDPDVTLEQVRQVCEYLGIDEMIARLPNGYYFNVKERGSTLSHGQKQLISFARALISNPSILILDEATASVDSESEILIQKAIETMVKGRTSIVIAHRLSTIKNAHKILVLEKGHIIEAGTHEELMRLQGVYYNMKTISEEKQL